MFESLEDAVRAYRDATLTHRRAAALRDYPTMDAAHQRIRSVIAYLREERRPELIHPLTMEWATAGRDDVEHARYRETVDRRVGPQATGGV
ncbi:hypothetical protein [Pseudonocardia sp. GCM10023141]|uniref:hypothetical protein n=1 Tax=Pseudonocardia sp. GCM10023141 TaxID=3252653 RepID=UPI003618AA3B